MEHTTPTSGYNKCKTIWTVVHVSLVFSFIFTAYKALECVQSSLNFESGLGTISISLLYISYVFSSACIGAPVVIFLTPKWTMCLCFLSHTLFIIANIWPSWYTLPLASLIVGLAAGPYWIAQGTYMTTLGVEYSTMTGTSLAQVAERFSSIFHAIWGMSGPLGNLITAVILGLEDRSTTCVANVNDTVDLLLTNGIQYNISGFQSGDQNINSTNRLAVVNDCTEPQHNTSLCGVTHCPYMESHLEVLQKPSDNLIYILMAVFLCFNLTAILLAACLNPVTISKGTSACSNLVESVKLTRRLDMLLLILSIFYIGVIPGIFYASFTQSFVSCAYGVSMVGYAMVAEGLGFTVASLICGPLAAYIPRVFHMMLSFVVFLGMGILWLIWTPQPGQEWVIITISTVFGFMHAIHRTHVAGLVSSLFPDDPSAAFTHYNTWLGLSYSISFAYSSLLCFNIKDYIFLFFTVVTAVSHFSLEARIWKRKKIVTIVRERDAKDRRDMGELMSVSYKDGKR